jgi:uncharacterized beta-barrel protein YwiB (DUF1934 family)
MRKNVIISIKGTQQVEKMHDKIEFVTNGIFEIKPDKYLIRYNESDITGYENTKTTLEIKNNTIMMIRKGQINTHMMFEKSKKHICHYDTGIGIMNMGINTKSLDTQLDKSGGSVYIKYSIDINNTHAGDNTLEISLREAKSANDKYDKIS